MVFQWSTSESPPDATDVDRLMFGVVLNREKYASLLDKGPLPDDPEVSSRLKFLVFLFSVSFIIKCCYVLLYILYGLRL